LTYGADGDGREDDDLGSAHARDQQAKIGR
jgi:hypothetical protein